MIRYALSIASLSAVVCCVTPTQARAEDAELQALKAQMQAMQAKISQLEAKQAKMAEEATAQKDAPAKPATLANGSPPPPNFIPVPGTNTSVRLGGAVIVEAMQDFGPKNGEGMNAAATPLSGTAGAYRSGWSHFTAKYTKLEFETNTVTDSDPVTTFVSMDFAGISDNGPAFHLASGYTPRLREAYIKYGNWQIGQTTPLFADPAITPEPLDFNLWLSGINLNRNPELRYTHPINTKWSWAVSLVGPASDYTPYNTSSVGQVDSGASGSNSSDASTNSLSRAPDLNAAVKLTDSWGHLMAHGMVRDIRVKDGTGINSEVIGWGTSLTGHLEFGTLPLTQPWGCPIGTYRVEQPAKCPSDIVYFGGTYGDGIGRYLTEAYWQSAILDSSNHLHTVKEWGAFLGYTHHWSDQWRTNARYGITRVDESSLLTSTAAGLWNTQMQTAAANVVYQIAPRFKTGLEYEWQAREVQSGAHGKMSRLVLGTYYFF